MTLTVFYKPIVLLMLTHDNLNIDIFMDKT